MAKAKPEAPVAISNEVAKKEEVSTPVAIQVTEQLQPEAPVAISNEVATVAASTQTISSSAENVNVNAGLTKVVIGYPENWEQPKFYNNGDEVFMSAETAEHFQTIGIAKIVTK